MRYVPLRRVADAMRSSFNSLLEMPDCSISSSILPSAASFNSLLEMLSGEVITNDARLTL